MRAYSLILFFLCLNLAGYIVSQLVSADVIMGSSEVMPYSSGGILTQFNLTVFATIGVGAGIAGIVAIITKQYVFASVVTVIWVVGLLFNVGNWILNGFPTMMGILLPPELSFMQVVFTAIVTFIFFFLLAETLGGKQMT